LFAGTKGVGAKYWYGWINPAGPEYPCIETAFIGQFILCRLADGTPCPPEDLTGCESHSDSRGWWSSMFNAQFVLYNPADLAQVATGKIERLDSKRGSETRVSEYVGCKKFPCADVKSEMKLSLTEITLSLQSILHQFPLFEIHN
jgi:hypothetical protein